MVKNQFLYGENKLTFYFRNPNVALYYLLHESSHASGPGAGLQDP